MTVRVADIIEKFPKLVRLLRGNVQIEVSRPRSPSPQSPHSNGESQDATVPTVKKDGLDKSIAKAAARLRFQPSLALSPLQLALTQV